LTSNYVIRLILELSATLFLVSFALGLIATTAGLLLPRLTRWFTASSVADMALALRLLPFAGSFAITAGVCAPSYLRFEPKNYEEAIGLPCMLVACAGAALWFESLGRAACAIQELSQFYRHCQSRLVTRTTTGKGDHWLIRSSSPVMACAGFLRPTLIVSDRVHGLLLPSQMELVFAHETAHACSLDNLKRLLILLTPDILPFARCLRKIEQTWEALAEQAADDCAVRGDPEAALSLAETLLLLARSSREPLKSPQSANLVRSFAHNPQTLPARVERLLKFEEERSRTLHISPLSVIATATGVLAACAVIWMNYSELQTVHIWLEHLVR
jgi:beta-lactamase regulating signal transducer with metallopeptidase domain